MSIVELEPIMKEPKLTYKDFEFEVGLDGQGDFVDIYVTKEASKKLGKEVGSTQIRVCSDEYLSENPADDVSLGKLEEKFHDMHLGIEDSDGLAVAINQSLASMRNNPKYPYKTKQ